MTQVDFAIISIRQDEFEAILQRFHASAQKGRGGRTYGIAQILTRDGKNCRIAVVRCDEQGNDTAQQVANDVISDLDPQMLLVVGIAGGISSDEFTLGDVIISNRIINLNVSKRLDNGEEEFDSRGGGHPLISDITASLPLHRERLSGWNEQASIGLISPKVDFQQFKSQEFKAKIASGGKYGSWYENVQKSILSQFDREGRLLRLPLVKPGTIGSSNSVVRNPEILIQWLQNNRSILAVEMEAAGVYLAAQKIRQSYPCMAIRGISDIVGFERNKQWTQYACETAAAFAYAFVTSGIISPREHTEIAKQVAVVPQALRDGAKISHEARSRKIFAGASAAQNNAKGQLSTYPMQKASVASSPTVVSSSIKQYKLAGVFGEYAGWVRCVAFSPDGQLLVGGGDNGNIKVWKVLDGECIGTFKGYAKVISHVVFSPDGRFLAGSSDNGTIKVWEVSTGQLMRAMSGHTRWVSSLTFSPDGQWLASGSDDKTVKLWDLANHRNVQTIAMLSDWVYSVAFSPDGQMLAAASLGKVVKLNILTKEVISNLKGATGLASSVVFSPNGQFLASGTDDGIVKIWEASTGKIVHTLLEHSGWIRSIVFSPDGKLLISGGDDQTIKLWDTSSGRCMQTVNGHSDRIFSVACSLDGHFFASGSRDRTIRLWRSL